MSSQDLWRQLGNQGFQPTGFWGEPPKRISVKPWVRGHRPISRGYLHVSIPFIAIVSIYIGDISYWLTHIVATLAKRGDK